MKVLIIGSSGQLARALMEATWPPGWEPAALGRPVVDLTQPETIAAALEREAPECIINAAAYTAVDKAESDRRTAFAINRDGVETLARACAARDIPLVHVSTDYVFDGSLNRPYSEDDPTSPATIYGMSKLAGEERIRALLPKHVILRTAWLFGPHGHNFVKTMLRLARTRDEIAVVDDQRGNPTYVPHLAEAIITLLRRLAAHPHSATVWGTYHLAGGGAATWAAMAREALAHSVRLGGPAARVRPITTADYPTPARRPMDSRLDCSKIARVLGITLPDWRRGVALCVQRLLKEKAA